MTTYRLTTMRDLLQLDERQLKKLCRELPRAMDYFRSIKNLVDCCVGRPASMDGWDGVFIWTDDEKDDVTVDFEPLGKFRVVRTESTSA